MANPYSEDLRIRAIKLIDEGTGPTDVSKILHISRGILYRWLDQRRLTASIKPKENWRKGYRPKITDLNVFKKFVDENVGLTSGEMAEEWGNISSKTIRKMLKRLGYTRKKRPMAIKKEMKKSEKNSNASLPHNRQQDNL